MPELDADPAWLAEEWAGQLTRVLASMMGESPSITCAPHELAAAEFDPAKRRSILVGTALQPCAGHPGLDRSRPANLGGNRKPRTEKRGSGGRRSRKYPEHLS